MKNLHDILPEPPPKDDFEWFTAWFLKWREDMRTNVPEKPAFIVHPNAYDYWLKKWK